MFFTLFLKQNYATSASLLVSNNSSAPTLLLAHVEQFCFVFFTIKRHNDIYV